MKERQSNFELMRILAMVAIVLGHFSVQGGLGLHPLFSSLPRIAVNGFILLSAWFLCDCEFSARRVTRTYLAVCFYSIPLTLISIGILGWDAVGFRFAFQGLVPFYGRSLWYASAYISLLLLAPFLNRVLSLPSRQLLALLGIVTAVFVVPSTIPAFSGLEYAADMVWFLVVYLFVGWFKRARVWDRLTGSWRYLLAGLVGYLLLVMGLRESGLGEVCNFWLNNIRALPNFAIAFCVFAFFAKLKLGVIHPINNLARGTLAVYVVHQVFAFRSILWMDICRADAIAALSPPVATGIAIVVAIMVFIGISMLDSWRRRLERYYLKLKPVQMAENWLEKFFNFPPCQAS